MKTKHNLYLGLLFLAGCIACNEEEPEAFQNIDGIYFDNRGSSNTVTDSVYVTFVYTNEDMLEIPVQVQALGRPAPTSRPIAIRVAGGDAEEGTDYELKNAAEIPAGALTLNYTVVLKRTAALKTRDRELVLELQANEHFILPFEYQVQAGNDTVPVTTYRIIFTDRFTVEPEGWNDTYGGDFSQQKFELMCRVLDLDRAAFNRTDGISLSRWYYICLSMTEYVSEQTKLKEAGKPYDTEAFDAQTGQPFTFEKRKP